MHPRRTLVVTAAALLAVPALLVAPAASGAGDGDGSGVASYIVSLRSGDPGAAAGRARANGAEVEHVYRHAIRGYAARMTARAAAALADDPSVAAVIPDRAVRITGQTRPPGIDRVNADASSTQAGNGKGAVDVDIAVIDTGIDARHRDLNVVGGVNCVPGGSSSNDLNGHGTHVSGTAAARDNGTGVVGVAPGARLWAVRVLDAQGSGLFSTIMCGVDWVTAHADVIEVANMSLGGSAPQGSCTDGGLHQAICASVDAGVTYVVSAGNSGSNAASFAPASYDEVITVSALTDFDGQPGGTGAPTCAYGTDDRFAAFSNYGEDVDLIAPGVCVLSTWRSGGYRSISGTSMASPHVAGGAALYLAGHPGAAPAEVRAALVAAGTDDWTGDPDSIHEPLLDVGGF
jgi:subtilisin